MRSICLVVLLTGLFGVSFSTASAEEICGKLAFKGTGSDRIALIPLEDIQALESGKYIDQHHKPHSGFAEVVTLSPNLDEVIEGVRLSGAQVCLYGTLVNSVTKVEWGYFDREGFLPIRNVELRSIVFVKRIQVQPTK
jgi:hypothetical protein